MAPFGLLTGWLLGRLARWRALLWALGPPLVLYAFHNWDLPVVACAVGAVYVMHGWRTDRPLADRATVAAVLLGLGFAFKLYPGAFVLPLALYVLTASPAGQRWTGAARCASPGSRRRHRGAGQPAVRAGGLRGLARRRSPSSSCARST